MINPDTRVQYTKSRLSDALLFLLEKQSISSISVKELCEQAGLNRGTFYLHYSDPLDLLREMEWSLYDRVMVFQETKEEENLKDAFMRQLNALEKEKRLCAAVLGHNGDPRFLYEVQDKAYRVVHDAIRKSFQGKSEGEIKLIFQMLFSGVTGVITVWLHGETDLSNEQIASMLAVYCQSTNIKRNG